MGKNHKHKKKLKSEKAKIHIKSKTKFLPKGQNVTDTTFKIKPIIIQEQLKEKDQSVLLSKRKSSISELLAKLKHYNDTVKAEACRELKELIKTHSTEIIQTHLSSIIQGLSVLIQDRERRVRKACVNLFREIFENVPTFKLEAFFNHILINLKCAMTNINKNIQEDSLLLLDALLEHKPQLIAEKFDRIFPDFLTLISKLRSQSAPERTLTLNLGSKLTSVKWRIKVLSRLYAILNAMIENGCKTENASSSDSFKPVIREASELMCIPIYRDIKPYEVCTFNYFGQNNETKQQPLDTQMNVLIPLLYETWVEAVPEEKTQKKDLSESTVLTEESAAVFSCVINILRLLHEFSQISSGGGIFTSKEATKFLEHLISNFPYKQRKSSKSEFIKDFSKLFKLNFDPNCVEENLVIIYLFVTFKVKNESGKRKFSFITHYLNKSLDSPYYVNSSNAKYLAKILREILLENPKSWHRLGVDNVEIMDSVISFYDQGRVPDNSRGAFLEILTSSAQFKYENQQEWLGKLPNCLCEDQISEKLINVILNLCRQNHQPTQEGVKNSLRQILDNLPTMKISGSADMEMTALSIAYIFFYVPNLSNNDVRAIYHFVETHEYLEYSKHLRNMLDFKMHVFK